MPPAGIAGTEPSEESTHVARRRLAHVAGTEQQARIRDHDLELAGLVRLERLALGVKLGAVVGPDRDQLERRAAAFVGDAIGIAPDRERAARARDDHALAPPRPGGPRSAARVPARGARRAPPRRLRDRASPCRCRGTRRPRRARSRRPRSRRARRARTSGTSPTLPPLFDTATTSSPRAPSCFTRCEPRKPVAPATQSFCAWWVTLTVAPDSFGF